MILKYLKKIPAGLMICPMFLGMLIHTFCPSILELGSFTTATFSNKAAATVMGVQLLCLGSQLHIAQIKTVAKRGGILILSKLLLGFIAAFFIGDAFIGGSLFGISFFAFICVITNINGSIYLSLMSVYGEESDSAAVTILSLTNGPFLTLIILGMTGSTSVSIPLLLATVLPILIGMLLGNISAEIRQFLKPGITLLLPFIGFTLGAGMHVKNLFEAGLAGLLLGVITIVLSSGISFLFDKLILKRPGYAGIATGAAGANAIAVPAAVALVDTRFLPYISTATAQISAAVVVCAICVPFLTGYAANYKNNRGKIFHNLRKR